MKSLLVLFTIFSFTLLIYQAGGVKEKDLPQLLQEETPKIKPDIVKGIFASFISGLQRLRNGSSKLRYLTGSLNPKHYGNEELRSCNSTDFEERFGQLVNITINLTINMSVSVEDICYHLSVCANTNFPKSISCFLSLTKTCETDIEQIKQAVYGYGPVADELLTDIYQDIIHCYHW